MFFFSFIKGTHRGLTLSKCIFSLHSTSCLLCSLYSQGHDLHWRGCVHLCYICHVLHPRQLCPLPHPREGEQSQASAICQRSKPSCLLVGQLCLGHGEYQLHHTDVSPLNWSLRFQLLLRHCQFYKFLMKSSWKMGDNEILSGFSAFTTVWHSSTILNLFPPKAICKKKNKKFHLL